jgi:hypothetical protein
MKNLTKKLSYAIYIVLCVVVLSSCKQTYYEYDLEDICQACEANGGVNRFHSDMKSIVVICKDGETKRLK